MRLMESTAVSSSDCSVGQKQGRRNACARRHGRYRKSRSQAHSRDKLSLFVSMVKPWSSLSFTMTMAAAPVGLATSTLSMKLQSVSDDTFAVSASHAA